MFHKAYEIVSFSLEGQHSNMQARIQVSACLHFEDVIIDFFAINFYIHSLDFELLKKVFTPFNYFERISRLHLFTVAFNHEFRCTV